jgi:hypothetical protein
MDDIIKICQELLKCMPKYSGSPSFPMAVIDHLISEDICIWYDANKNRSDLTDDEKTLMPVIKIAIFSQPKFHGGEWNIEQGRLFVRSLEAWLNENNYGIEPFRAS